MTKKFEVVYIIAREGIAFAKMSSLCDLIERQGVSLDESYRTNVVCSTFINFIAEDLHLGLFKALQSQKFFSLHMDGSTDDANVEEEMFCVPTWMSVTLMVLFM